MTVQDFVSWIDLKIKAHFAKPRILFREREIWMTYYGQNVGSEENGKGEQFHRPVIILKKLNSEIFICVPTSTVVKPEKSYYVPYRQRGVVYSAMISHVRTLDAKRCVYRMGRIDEQDYARIKGFVAQYFL